LDPQAGNRKKDKLQGTECSADQREAQLHGIFNGIALNEALSESLCLVINAED
jgi:hypothetical protein